MSDTYTRAGSYVPLDIYIDFKGWRWTAPFICMRCGIEVSAEQWAFSRSCGSCDCGHSPTARLSIFDQRLFAGPHKLIEEKDKGRDDLFFLAEDRFLDPADREKFPVLEPPKQPFPPLHSIPDPVLQPVPFVPSPFPPGLGTCSEICGQPGHADNLKPHVRNDACWNWKPLPISKERGSI